MSNMEIEGQGRELKESKEETLKIGDREIEDR